MPQSARISVLFDLDGVLLDTEPLYTEATQAIVGRYGKTYDWSLKQHTMGRDARLTARFILERLDIPLSAEEFLAARAPILDALLASSPAIRGAEEFVRQLAADRVPIAVATSSDRRLFELKTRRHAFFDAFAAVVCGDDPRVTAKKPAPDIFLAAARDLGTDPSRCVVIEDSPAGVEAALAAGMRVIAMPDPAMSTDHYGGAHRVVTGYDGLSFTGIFDD
jgi:pseudouridine-5'-monophosphatase